MRHDLRVRVLRWRRVGPVLGVVASAAAMAHAWVPADDALRSPDGSWGVGIARPAGVTVVLDGGTLVPSDPTARVELVSVDVSGPGRDPAIARSEVKVLHLDENGNGGIGALTTDDLAAATRAGKGWELVEPAGVVLGNGDRGLWQAVVVVTGLSEGTWTSDHLVVQYRVDGRPGRQVVPVTSTLCVSGDAAAACPPDVTD